MKSEQEKSVSKADIDKHLRRIANVLLLNGSITDNLGLINGKIGISIFFFHYFIYANKKIYSEYAGELIDEIYEEISIRTPVNFEDGLTGIGWGIEYIVKNGFVQADTDEALKDMDDAISKKLLSAVLTSESCKDLAGYGFYFLSRLRNRPMRDESHAVGRIMPNIKYFISYLERIFVNNEFHDFDLSLLTDEIISSLLWFLLETNRLIPDFGQLEKVIKSISAHVESSLLNPVNGSIDQWLKYITEQVINSVPDKQLKTVYDLISDKEKSALRSINFADTGLVVKNFIKNVWQNLVYENNIGENSIVNPGTKEMFSIISTQEYWDQLLDNIKPNDLGLHGLSGLGLGILGLINDPKIFRQE